MPASLDGSEFSLDSNDSKNPFTVISAMSPASFSSTKMNSDSFISTLSPPPGGDLPDLRDGNPAARRPDRPEKARRDRLRGSRETRRTRSDHAPSHHGGDPGGGFRIRRGGPPGRHRAGGAPPREGPAGGVRGGDRGGMRQRNAG